MKFSIRGRDVSFWLLTLSDLVDQPKSVLIRAFSYTFTQFHHFMVSQSGHCKIYNYNCETAKLW